MSCTSRFALAAAVAGTLIAGYAGAQYKTVRVTTGLSRPLWVGAPPGDTRLFVVEQTTADVRILKNGVLQATPFIDLTSKVNTGGNERGLLGFAFSPNYATDGYFFVQYTAGALPGTSIVERYQVSTNPDVANAASGQIVLSQPQPFENHNGGNLVFGPDGYLYLGYGDGGSQNDPSCNGQKGSTWLGKMLRIDVSSLPYTIPPTNPWAAAGDGVLDEIWAFGLRNPWRYTFDDATGDLYIGDVGQNTIEEIDVQPAGAGGRNYGWKVMEGNNCFSTTGCTVAPPACGSPVYTAPIQSYTHTAGCSVTGGVVYRGCAIPALDGTYFYADYCSNSIWSLKWNGAGGFTNFTNQTATLAPGGGLSIATITSFGVDGFGELYLCDRGAAGTGELFKIVPTATPTDCDGNSHSDACEIGVAPHKDLDLNGQLDLCQGLSADKGSVSESAGGVQQLSIHMGAAMAGKLYLTLTSGSGSAPGLVVDGVPVPLNLDSLVLTSLSMANSLPWLQSLGFLDGAGRGLTNFTIPAASTGLAGANVAHATIAFDLGLGAVVGATNHVTLSIVP
ncbi:MAG: cadherin [Planctomycetota bacterium]|nr:MAG: cadherin [Planctomycetota bacterium]